MRSFLLVLLFGFFIATHAGVEENMTDLLKENSQKVTAILKDKNISKAQQDQELIKIVDPLFDFNLMGKLCLGKEIYTGLTSEQKAKFQIVFNKKIKESYTSKLHLYTDEKLEFETAKKVKEDRMTIQSYLITKTERKPVIYKMYENSQQKWLIYDVDIFGVSIVQTYRNQFSAALKTQSFEQFLVELGKNS